MVPRLLSCCFKPDDVRKRQGSWANDVLIIICELLFLPIFLVLLSTLLITNVTWKREIAQLRLKDMNARLQADLAALGDEGLSDLTAEERRSAEVARGRYRAAVSLHGNQKYQQAEEAFREALPALIRTLGAEHPDTLACALSLARLLNSQGRRSTILATYGLANAHTFPLLFSRAARSEQFAKAEELLRETLLVCRNKLGRTHPRTIEFVHELSFCLQRQAMQSDSFGQTIEAMSLAHDAVETLSSTLGGTHERTQRARHFVERLEVLHARENLTAVLNLRVLAFVFSLIAAGAVFIASMIKGENDPLLAGVLGQQAACDAQW
jgi:hypothetical protein